MIVGKDTEIVLEILNSRESANQSKKNSTLKEKKKGRVRHGQEVEQCVSSHTLSILQLSLPAATNDETSLSMKSIDTPKDFAMDSRVTDRYDSSSCEYASTRISRT